MGTGLGDPTADPGLRSRLEAEESREAVGGLIPLEIFVSMDASTALWSIHLHPSRLLRCVQCKHLLLALFLHS